MVTVHCFLMHQQPFPYKTATDSYYFHTSTTNIDNDIDIIIKS